MTDGSVGPGDRPTAGFAGVATRIRNGAAAVAGLALVAAVADGLTTGFGMAVVTRWVGLALVGVPLVTAGVVALDAYRRADAAQRQGDRLAGDDVGILPPRPRRPR